MFFSPSSQQALRALIHLARHEPGQPVLARDIAAAETIPHPFLSKLMHSLRKRGLVRAIRGPGGGYTLARPAEEIVLTEIVETFDGTRNLASACILGLDECGENNPCALHERWTAFREIFAERISSMTLYDVAHTLVRKRRVQHSASSAGRRHPAKSRKKVSRSR